jgi:hypothetical protein
MRSIQFFLLLMWFTSCNNIPSQQSEYEYPHLKNVILESILFSHWNSQQVYVYNQFDNRSTKEIVGNIILSFDKDLNYIINDSLVKYISQRPNRRITKKLIENDSNITLISDTSKFDNYIIFSEPFSIDNKWMCFSISRRDSISKTRKHFIFYVKKVEGRDQFDSPFIYDWQKDVLLEESVIK